MTCKDCIHYPICQRFTELGYSITEERKDLAFFQSKINVMITIFLQ